MNSLSKSISVPSNYAYITHHANTYGNVPLWVAMNALTFGQVSKMYQYAPTDIRTKIRLINDTLKKCPHISKEHLLKNMGFPENWDKILRYKK